MCLITSGRYAKFTQYRFAVLWPVPELHGNTTCEIKVETHLVDVLVGLDEVDAELVQRRGGGVTEVVRDASLHGLDVGGRRAHPWYARSRGQRRRDLLELLLGHEATVQRCMMASSSSLERRWLQ